jgi:hypothetical protein
MNATTAAPLPNREGERIAEMSFCRRRDDDGASVPTHQP